MKKILVFDGQVFQTSAWDRGMGKYSLAMLEEMAQLWNADQKTYIVFNTHYPLSDEAKRVLDTALPNVKKVFLNLQVPEIKEHEFDTAAMIEKTKKNEQILTEFVASIKPQTNKSRIEYFILSLFLDEVCAAFPHNTTNTLLFYDLIPLLFAERYSRNENYAYYLARIPTVFKADKILAISQTVADDLSMHLGIDPGRITNIQGAPIKRRQIDSKPVRDFDSPFILMASGNDMRKNNINAVRGFEEYVASTGRSDLSLAITSHFDEYAQDELREFSDNLHFTGNVSEGELKWLYENAEAVMFVPEYEGLGLPILEAVEFSKPIVCSSIGAFREMSETAFYYANHPSVSDIAGALGRALSGEGWQDRLEEYPGILKSYTWRKTAQLALQATADERQRSSAPKKKLAVIGPTPRGYSAIGKVLQQMHPSLAERFDVDYFLEWGAAEHDPIRQDYLQYATNVYNATEFNADRYASYDAVLYHIGNSEYHINAIKSALYLPGYMIIHDTKLPEIFALMQNFGYVAETRYEAEGRLDKKSGVKETAYLSSLAANQLGVIVHSKYARKAIQEAVTFYDSKLPVKKVNLPTGSSKLGRSDSAGRLNVGMAGVIHEGKGLRLLEDLTSREEFGNINFSIFGVPVASKEVMDRIEQNERIHIATNLTDREFQDEISHLDILVNYREEYRGETSLSTLEAMRVGVVPIVRNVGWYAELPDSVAIKLDDGGDIPLVLQKIRRGEIDIKTMSRRTREYVTKNYSYEAYSAQLEELLSDRPDSVSQKIDAIKQGDIESLLHLLAKDAPS